MNIALALEALLALAIALSVVFSIWRIAGDVRRIREHFDRVDHEAAQKLGYSPRPAGAPKPPPAEEIPGSLGLKP
jgi:hypothetical protein